MNLKGTVISSFANFLLGSDVFTRVKGVVVRLDDQQLSGTEKRDLAVKEVKTIGLEIGEWLVNLAIELAVAWIKTKAK